MTKNKSSQDKAKSTVHRTSDFSPRFQQERDWWNKQKSNKASKVFKLVKAVEQDPFHGLGKPEPLKYVGADTWSRRIDLEHRLVYRVHSNYIEFIACRYHYNAK
ncbi:MAG: Txe/YoeB family addiction module toxin [Oscillatoria sp. SIO1A7]|nr:Txe/YoeB family addiction module toxin [Oscillatoria sp. SIO1A7]